MPFAWLRSVWGYWIKHERIHLQSYNQSSTYLPPQNQLSSHQNKPTDTFPSKHPAHFPSPISSSSPYFPSKNSPSSRASILHLLPKSTSSHTSSAKGQIRRILSPFYTTRIKNEDHPSIHPSIHARILSHVLPTFLNPHCVKKNQKTVQKPNKST